jgi:hypothetical protein
MLCFRMEDWFVLQASLVDINLVDDLIIFFLFWLMLKSA